MPKAHTTRATCAGGTCSQANPSRRQRRAPGRTAVSSQTVSRLDQRLSLDTLTKARLLELAAAFELDVVAGHPKAEIIDTLAASERASFEQILLVLSRDELKEICRSHGVVDKGREKQVLVDRILGREVPSKGKRVYDLAKAKAQDDAPDAPRKRGRRKRTTVDDARQGTLVDRKYRVPKSQGETARMSPSSSEAAAPATSG